MGRNELLRFMLGNQRMESGRLKTDLQPQEYHHRANQRDFLPKTQSYLSLLEQDLNN